MEALRIVTALVVVGVILAGLYVYQQAPATTGVTGGVETGQAQTVGGESGGAPTSQATNTTTQTTTTETTTTTTSGESNETGSVETYQAGLGEEIMVNYEVNVGEGTLYIKSYTVTYENGVPQILLNLQLPNPCYQAKLLYEPERTSLVLNLTSPPPGTMCIQVVEWTTLTATLDPAPDTQTVKLVIVKDGRTLQTLDIQIPPPVTSQP